MQATIHLQLCPEDEIKLQAMINDANTLTMLIGHYKANFDMFVQQHKELNDKIQEFVAIHLKNRDTVH